MTVALEKLPTYEGVLYRGVALGDPKDVERLVAAKGYELNLHSSASTDPGVAMTFADAQSVGGRERAVLLELHGRGRNINPYLPEELQSTKEVVLMAGTRYKFASLAHKREESLGLDYIHLIMKEVR